MVGVARMNESLEQEAALLPYEVTVIVPTYKEAENIPELIRRLALLKNRFSQFKVLIIDDNSRDGSDEVFKSLKVDDWAKFIVRTGSRGLSPSVIDGLNMAETNVLVVMDADLSHPPESIPQMVEALHQENVQMVFGSRYCKGGGIDQDWSMFRRINSLGATLLSRPFTSISDPMSGFMALRKTDFVKSAPLNPIGYKIGLELLVKCHFKNVQEIPIQFADRHKGESKLTMGEQIKYLRHIKRLADYKFGNLSFLIQFCFVGLTGLFVDMSVVTFFHWMGMSLYISNFLGVAISMHGNFLLNRYITFDHGRRDQWFIEYRKYIAACALGAVVNYVSRLGFLFLWPQFQQIPQVAVIVGAIFGLSSNFFFSRYMVFGKNLVTQKKR